MPGRVETSTNLASVRMKKEDKTIVVATSQRSEIESRKNMAAGMVKSLFLLAGAEVRHSEGYPGWAPDPDSPILRLASDSYRKLFHADPVVRSIHAGLECGLFLEKYPDLDMISIGPTIKGAHSPSERIEIRTVVKFWNHLVDILESFGFVIN
jgi:dipeptidase D